MAPCRLHGYVARAPPHAATAAPLDCDAAPLLLNLHFIVNMKYTLSSSSVFLSKTKQALCVVVLLRPQPVKFFQPMLAYLHTWKYIHTCIHAHHVLLYYRNHHRFVRRNQSHRGSFIFIMMYTARNTEHKKKHAGKGAGRDGHGAHDRRAHPAGGRHQQRPRRKALADRHRHDRHDWRAARGTYLSNI